MLRYRYSGKVALFSPGSFYISCLMRIRQPQNPKENAKIFIARNGRLSRKQALVSKNTILLGLQGLIPPEDGLY
jgi:hypothetical protein